MSKIRNICINGLLVFVSLFLLGLFLEFFVFRFILIATELPKIDFVDGLVKYQPHQEGVYRVKNEIKAEYRINADGWNSVYDRYNINKPANKYRIAIVGDSFVEATEVDYDKSLAERLESKLGKENFEVYRFGISGAPLSQYLFMLRSEVGKYQPDFVVVVIVHNDFDESYRYLRGSYASNFMKLRITDDGVFEELPEGFNRPWYTPIRETATWRYLAYRQQIPYEYLKDLLLGNKPVNNQYQANILKSSISDNRVKNEIVTDYFFKKTKEYCDSKGIKLLVIMSGVMEVIYNKIDKAESQKTGALFLNEIAKNAALRRGVEFIDFEPIFESDFEQNQKRFTFINDGHWNEYGHEVVANVIYQYIKKSN